MNSPQGGHGFPEKSRRPPHRPQSAPPRQEPTIDGGVRGFVFVRTAGLLDLYRHLARATSPTIAMGDLAEWLVLAIDLAFNCSTINAGGNRLGVGYRHRLLSPGSWNVRRRRLVAAGALLTDDSGRVTAIATAWRETVFVDSKRQAGAKLGVCTPVHRDGLRPLVAQLRNHRGEHGRPLPGIGRLLILLIILGAPDTSNEQGHVLKSQRQLGVDLGVRRPTISRAMALLADLGLLCRPQKRRHSTTLRNPEEQAWVYLDARDRLAGRTWRTVTPAADTPQPSPGTGSRLGPTYGPTHPLPPAGRTNPPTQREGECLKGSTEPLRRLADLPSTELHEPHPVARRGARPWIPGPATTHPVSTVTAVAGLEHNLVSLHEHLAWWADQPDGRQLCDAVTIAVREALHARDRHTAGETLSDAERNLVDVVARLARAIDHLAQAPCPDLHAHFLEAGPTATGPAAGRWFGADGQLRPYNAALILAHRIAAHAERARSDPRSRPGNWRQRVPHRQPADLHRNTPRPADDEPPPSGLTTMGAAVANLAGPLGETLSRLADTGLGSPAPCRPPNRRSIPLRNGDCAADAVVDGQPRG